MTVTDCDKDLLMIRTCVECGRDFEARSSRAQRCGAACRKRASRKSGPIEAVAVELATTASSLVEAVAVRVAGVESSPEAQAALVLARRIDSGAEPLAAVATATKELSRLLSTIEVPASSGASTNPLDDLAKRRERRAAV